MMAHSERSRHLSKACLLQILIPELNTLGTPRHTRDTQMEPERNVCRKCGKHFRAPSILKRHMERKTPCDPIMEPTNGGTACRYCGREFASKPSMNRHMRQYCKIANTEEGMEKLFEHTLQRQLAEQRQETKELRDQVAAQTAQVAELTALLKQQLAVAPPHLAAPAAPVTQRASAIQNAQTVQNVGIQNNHITQVQVTLPWDGGELLRLAPARLEALLGEEGFRRYASWPGEEQTDTERASPYVLEALLGVIKASHEDPAQRNVCLNPRRADQCLVLTREERWLVLSLDDTTRALFDGAAKVIRLETLTESEVQQLPMEARNALGMVRTMYYCDPDEYVAKGKAPLAAHLENLARAIPREQLK